MTFLTPTFLLFGLLAVPILLLYMLKLRRREVEVSSVLLWSRLLRDRQANTPWQKLRRNLLLFLQLLVLAALAIALARPAQLVPALVDGPVVVVLDASASMNATDGEPTRFDAARTLAMELVTEKPSSAPATLILAGSRPRILLSGERDSSALRTAVESATSEAGETDWEAAFALAAGAGAAGQPATIIILSDGGLPAQGLPPLPGEVRYVPVGVSGENLAISALALRSLPSGARPEGGIPAARVEALARITNYGDATHSAILSFYDGEALLHAERISLPAGESRSLVLLMDSVLGSGGYSARLSPLESASSPLDALPLDDVAYAVYHRPPGGRVLLVSPGNLFLEQVLYGMPGVQPFRILPDEAGVFELPAEPFDMYILDGVFPAGLPAGAPLLLVNPPENKLFSVGVPFSDTLDASVVAHPLVTYLDWSGVSVRQARQVDLPVWAQSLVETPTGPLVFAGDNSGRRVAALTFDLHESDLPLQVAFPVLMDGLVRWLLGSQPVSLSANTILPGEPVTVHAPAATVTVGDPSGSIIEIPLVEGEAVFAETGTPGLYRVQAGTDAAFFAVNLFSPGESTIRPAGSLQVGLSKLVPAHHNELGERELWPWLALLALGLLVVEWFIYHRKNLSTKTTRASRLQS